MLIIAFLNVGLRTVAPHHHLSHQNIPDDQFQIEEPCDTMH
jgi:hypothetical protein